MALKNYKPTSPGLRQLVIVDRSELYKGKPEKTLTVGLTKTGGRDNYGHVTSRRIGGGHKRKLRVIDFKRRKFDLEATVERIEYDPNRSAFIALISYEDGEKAYILAPQRLKAGDKVYFPKWGGTELTINNEDITALVNRLIDAKISKATISLRGAYVTDNGNNTASISIPYSGTTNGHNVQTYCSQSGVSVNDYYTSSTPYYVGSVWADGEYYSGTSKTTVTATLNIN